MSLPSIRECHERLAAAHPKVHAAVSLLQGIVNSDSRPWPEMQQAIVLYGDLLKLTADTLTNLRNHGTPPAPPPKPAKAAAKPITPRAPVKAAHLVRPSEPVRRPREPFVVPVGMVTFRQFAERAGRSITNMNRHLSTGTVPAAAQAGRGFHPALWTEAQVAEALPRIQKQRR